MPDDKPEPQIEDALKEFLQQGEAAKSALNSVLAAIERQKVDLERSAKKARAMRRAVASMARRMASGPLKSRTALMHERRIAKGLCSRCGKEPLAPNSKTMGVNCLKKERLYKASKNKKK